MTLYLLRHGIAEDAPPGGDDRARRLTPRGRSRLAVAARGLLTLRIELDVLLTSPLPRAAETAAIVTAAYQRGPSPREVPALAPGVLPAETLQALRPWSRHDWMMLVGHEPGLSRLASLVLTGSAERLAIDLKKGGCIAIELEKLVPPTGATLRWLLTARQLRRLGR
ncbi:MAG: phosphohistidine phosphatase SixA [Deltaproteobacteria bacterium]|nr:MAG: phosphohistidine phosphatase SixA [Deltaproteobacteria bacterium]